MEVEYDTSQLHPDHKAHLLNLLKFFVQICEDQNLQYYCCGGTAIGAVRHGGMIPWDDDIDLLMPRQDYNRFIKIMSCHSYEGYELMSPRASDNFYLPYLKLSKSKTSLLEHTSIPCVLGVNIDIFPLDGATSNFAQCQQDLLKFKKASNKLMAISKRLTGNLKAMLAESTKIHLRTAFNELRYIFSKKSARIKVLNEIDNILMKYPFHSADFVGNYSGMWGIREFGPKKWFDGYEERLFEGFIVRIPMGYQELLTQMYGDYMNLPPVEKRSSHHSVIYLNLNERKSFDDIINEIN